MRHIKFDYEALTALAEIEICGSFVAAANKMRVTQSALSQRLRKLEIEFGHSLVKRTLPCTLTDWGRKLVAHLNSVRLVENDFLRSFDLSRSKSFTVPLALSAESYEHLLKDLPLRAFHDLKIGIQIEIADEDKTIDLLRSGKVLGCVSTVATTPNGCLSEALGGLIYRMVIASKARTQSANAVKECALLRFGPNDQLHKKILPNYEPASSIYLPSPQELVRATLQGLGACVLPEIAVKKDLDSGVLELISKKRLHVPLYWHYRDVGSKQLNDLAKLVLRIIKARQTT